MLTSIGHHWLTSWVEAPPSANFNAAASFGAAPAAAVKVASNLAGDHSFELGTMSYTAMGSATLTRTQEQTANGSWALRVDTTTTSTSGVQQLGQIGTTEPAVKPSSLYMARALIYGTAGNVVRFETRLWNGTAATSRITTHTLAVTGWNRISNLTLTLADTVSATLKVYNNTAAAQTFWLDDLSIQEYVEIPQFSDNFDRPDTTDSLGPDWTMGSAKAKIVANRAAPASISGTLVRTTATFDAVKEGNYSEVTYVSRITDDSGFNGPALYVPPIESNQTPAAIGEFYTFWLTSSTLSNVSIRRKDNLAGTYTQLAARSPGAQTLPVTMRLVDDGDELVGLLNGVEVIRVAKSVAPLTNGGLGAGVYMDMGATAFAEGYAFDDFKMGNTRSVRAENTLTDTFDTQDTSKWTFQTGSSVSGGTVNFTPSTAYPTVFTKNRHDLRGSHFSAELVERFTNANSGEHGIGVDDGSSANRVTMIVDNLNRIYYRFTINGVHNTTQGTYDPVAMRWLRIRESGGTVYQETSPDGRTWTVQRSHAPPFDLSSVVAHMKSGYFDSTQTPTGTTRFDNANIVPAAPATPEHLGAAAFNAAAALTAGGTVSTTVYAGDSSFLAAAALTAGGTVSTVTQNAASALNAAAALASGGTVTTPTQTGAATLNAAVQFVAAGVIATPKVETAGLRAWVEGYTISTSGSETYVVPTVADRDGMRAAWDDLRAGNLANAAVLAAPYGYDVVDFTDTETSRKFYILRERDPKARYWGAYVWSREADRNPSIIAAPHTVADLHTEKQSVDIFIKANSTALFITGSHRNTNAALDTDGDNVSDVANVSDPPSSIFQEITKATATASLTFVEPHGYGTNSVPPLGSAHRQGFATAVTEAATTSTVNPSTRWKTGHTLLAFVAIRDTAATVTAPSGWTLVGEQNDGAAPGLKTQLWTKVRAEGDTSYTWTWGPTAVKSIIEIVGYDSCGGIDVAAGGIEPSTTTVTTHSTPSITTTTADDVLVAFYAVTNATNWDAAGATGATSQIVTRDTTTTGSISAAIYDNDDFTSPVGTYTASAVNPTASTIGGFFLVSLKPGAPVRVTDIIISSGVTPQQAYVGVLFGDFQAAGYAVVLNDGTWPYMATGNEQGKYVRSVGGSFAHIEQVTELRTTVATRESVATQIAERLKPQTGAANLNAAASLSTTTQADLRAAATLNAPAALTAAATPDRMAAAAFLARAVLTSAATPSTPTQTAASSLLARAVLTAGGTVTTPTQTAASSFLARAVLTAGGTVSTTVQTAAASLNAAAALTSGGTVTTPTQTAAAALNARAVLTAGGTVTTPTQAGAATLNAAAALASDANIISTQFAAANLNAAAAFAGTGTVATTTQTAAATFLAAAAFAAAATPSTPTQTAASSFLARAVLTAGGTVTTTVQTAASSFLARAVLTAGGTVTTPTQTAAASLVAPAAFAAAATPTTPTQTAASSFLARAVLTAGGTVSTPTQAGAAALNAAASLAAGGVVSTVVQTAAASLNAAAAFAAAATPTTPTQTAAASLNAAAAFAGTGTVTTVTQTAASSFLAAAAFAGTGTVSTITQTAASSLLARAVLTAGGTVTTPTQTGAAALNARAVLTAGGTVTTPTQTAASSFLARAVLTAGGTVSTTVQTAAASLVAPAALAAGGVVSTITQTAAATLNAAAALVSDATAGAPTELGAASLIAPAAFTSTAATSTVVQTAAAALNARAALAAAATVTTPTTTAAAPLNAPAALAAAATVTTPTATAAAPLNARAVLTAGGTVTTTVQTAAAPLNARAVLTAGGTVTTTVQTAASSFLARAVLTAGGTVTTPTQTAAASLAAPAALTAGGTVTTTVQTAAASINAAAALAADLQPTRQAAATLNAAAALSGAATTSTPSQTAAASFLAAAALSSAGVVSTVVQTAAAALNARAALLADFTPTQFAAAPLNAAAALAAAATVTRTTTTAAASFVAPARLTGAAAQTTPTQTGAATFLARAALTASATVSTPSTAAAAALNAPAHLTAAATVTTPTATAAAPLNAPARLTGAATATTTVRTAAAHFGAPVDLHAQAVIAAQAHATMLAGASLTAGVTVETSGAAAFDAPLRLEVTPSADIAVAALFLAPAQVRDKASVVDSRFTPVSRLVRRNDAVSRALTAALAKSALTRRDAVAGMRRNDATSSVALPVQSTSAVVRDLADSLVL